MIDEHIADVTLFVTFIGDCKYLKFVVVLKLHVSFYYFAYF
jgi:hypothetical protein